MLYFHTPIADSNVVLVVEIVVYQEAKNPLLGEETIVTAKTFGWGVIRPFKPEMPLKDVSNEDAPNARKYVADEVVTSQQTNFRFCCFFRMDVYQGTPRALLFMKHQIESTKLFVYSRPRVSNLF